MASWRAYIRTADVPPALAPLTWVYCKQRIVLGGLKNLPYPFFQMHATVDRPLLTPTT